MVPAAHPATMSSKTPWLERCKPGSGSGPLSGPRSATGTVPTEAENANNPESHPFVSVVHVGLATCYSSVERRYKRPSAESLAKALWLLPRTEARSRVPLGLELIKGLPIPTIGNHLRVVRHELPEAMELLEVEGIGKPEPDAEEVRELLEGWEVLSGHGYMKPGRVGRQSRTPGEE